MQSIGYQRSIDQKVLELLSHSNAEHASEKQNLEQEARQIIELKQSEILDIQQKATERMQQIYDDAQRSAMQQDNKFVQLQAEHQQLADELKSKVEEAALHKQQQDNLMLHLKQMQQQADHQVAGLLNQLAQAEAARVTMQASLSSDAGTRQMHFESLEKQIQELRKDSAVKDAKIIEIQHELERNKFHLNSASDKEKNFESQKRILSAELLDSKSKLESESAEVKSLQSQVKELLIAKACPPVPRKYSIASPRIKPTRTSSQPVPKLNLATVMPHLEDWQEDADEGEGYEEEEWDEE